MDARENGSVHFVRGDFWGRKGNVRDDDCI